MCSLSSTKRIALCADDYGQNDAISNGIITLLQSNRINAVSCMVNRSIWTFQSQRLLTYQSSAALGLHLNLTDGMPISSVWRLHHGDVLLPLPHLIQAAYLRRLNYSAIVAEISAQLHEFASALGRYPDFIDGHQHVHQFAMIRDALFEVYRTLKLQAWIRSTSSAQDKPFCRWSGFTKRMLIACLGGQLGRRRLLNQGIPTNTGFAGIYPFKRAFDYRCYFQSFLTDVQTGSVIMCHPGAPSNDAHDPLASYRHYEQRYFLSDAFLNDLKKQNVELACKGKIA